jgi:hypothetical protein
MYIWYIEKILKAKKKNYFLIKGVSYKSSMRCNGAWKIVHIQKAEVAPNDGRVWMEEDGCLPQNAYEEAFSRNLQIREEVKLNFIHSQHRITNVPVTSNEGGKRWERKPIPKMATRKQGEPK